MMAYLPQTIEHDTERPTATDEDLQTALALVKEKWDTFYPEIPYEQIDAEPRQDANDNMQTGVAGQTIVDDLYGEDVPAANATGDWVQPHSSTDSPTANAPDARKFQDIVNVRAHVNQEPTERLLRRFGIEERRDAIVTFATPVLDAAGVTVKTGDRFKWDRRYYEVLEVKRKGYWKFTDVNLYIVALCVRYREGS